MKRLSIRGAALAVGLFCDVRFLSCAILGLVVPQRLETMAYRAVPSGACTPQVPPPPR